MQIVSMEDLKDTEKIENMCVAAKAPVFVKEDGLIKLVFMDIESFERITNQIYETKLLNEGLADFKEGKVVDGKTVMGEMRKKYGME